MVEKKADFGIKNKYDKSPFNLLYSNENPSAIKAAQFFISKGCNDWSESLRSCCNNETVNTDVISFLLDKKADPNEPGSNEYNYDGRSALQLLCYNKGITLDALEILLSNKADPNFKDNDRKTSLHLIFENENFSLSFASTLIQNKADPNLLGKKKKIIKPKFLVFYFKLYQK